MTQFSRENKEKLSNSKVVMTSLVAGAVAGALAKTAIAPLDRTKINFQVANKKYSTREAFQFLMKSYQQEGFIALWRGNSATMARIMPYAAVQFTSHEQWKRILHVDTGIPQKQWNSGKVRLEPRSIAIQMHYQHASMSNNRIYTVVLNVEDPRDSEKQRRFLAGSLAGITSQSLTYPLDLARARMAVTKKNTYNSLSEVFVKTWQVEGPYAFYKGYLPTILGVIPYAGVSFFTYGTLQNYILVQYGATSAITNLFCGAVAGVLGQTSSYPLDIVRRRMQTSAITGGNYNSILGTLISVIREEGLHGIYKGLSMNWVKGPIAVGISFATYDHIRDTLRSLLSS